MEEFFLFVIVEIILIWNMRPFPRRSINNDRQINSLQFHIQRDDIDMKYEKKKIIKRYGIFLWIFL